MNLHTLPSLKLTLAPENRPSPKERNFMFQPLIFEGKLLVLQSVIDPTCLVILDILEKKTWGFFRVSPRLGPWEGLSLCSFHCIARNIHGSDFLEIWSRKLVMLFGVIRWMMICMGISDVKFWRNMSRISTFTLIIQLDVFMSVCKLQQFCLARRRAHYTTHMITHILSYTVHPIIKALLNFSSRCLHLDNTKEIWMKYSVSHNHGSG